jgi:hypothetical protein
VCSRPLTPAGLTEGAPDFLGEREQRPCPAIDRQRLGAEDDRDPGEQILQFRDPPNRLDELLVHITEPFASLRTSAQNRPESIGVAVQDGRLSIDKQSKHLRSHVIAVH